MKHKGSDMLLGGSLVIGSALLTTIGLSYFGFLEWDEPPAPDTMISSPIKDDEPDSVETQPTPEPDLRQVIEPKEAVNEAAEKSVEDWSTSGRVGSCISRLESLIEAKAISKEDILRIVSLIEENKIDAAIQELDSLPEPTDPWANGELSEEMTRQLRDKASIFGASFQTVVGYEMARARISTPRIIQTLKTYGSFHNGMLLDLDRIMTAVDDRHFRQRLYQLSNAIDRELSSGN